MKNYNSPIKKTIEQFHLIKVDIEISLNFQNNHNRKDFEFVVFDC